MGIKSLSCIVLALYSAGALAQGASVEELKLRCLKEDGSISGDGTSENTCKNLLPKCADLQNDYQKKIRDLLSLKIYGYYQNKDLDLNKTTLEHPVGSELKTHMCSVVGHFIVYKGDADIEVNYHNGAVPISNEGKQKYTGMSCGELPRIHINKSDKIVNFIFEDGKGARWSNVMLGAMPYEIRAHYDQFLQKAKTPDGVSSFIQDETLKELSQEYVDRQKELSAFYQSLPEESKAACSDGSRTGMLDSCLGKPGTAPIPLNDPAHRTCAIAKAYMAMNSGALPSLVVAQIVLNAKKDFDNRFSKLVSAENDHFQKLKEAASEGTSWWSSGMKSKRKRAAIYTSSVMDGHWWRTSGDWDGYPTDGSGKRNRKGKREIAFKLDSDTVSPVKAGPANNDAGKKYQRKIRHEIGGGWMSLSNILGVGIVASAVNGIWGEGSSFGFNGLYGHALTLNNGFEGLVEYMVRHEICGQNSVTDPSSKCGEDLIPTKPVGVKW